MTQPVWIDEAVVLAIHDRLLVEHVGAEGLRDESLLRSELARPQNHLAYSGADLLFLAAMYTAGIVKNYPFIDCNKRTAFVLGILFLELNGFRFKATDEAAAQAVLELAAGAMDELGYSEFLRANANRVRK
jgi:death on curing protein